MRDAVQESFGVNHLKQLYLDTVGKLLSPSVNDDILRIQEDYEKAKEKIKDPQTLKAFERLFDTMNMGEYILHIPRPRVQLSIREIILLLNAKVRISNPDQKKFLYPVKGDEIIGFKQEDGTVISSDDPRALTTLISFRFSVNAYQTFYAQYNRVIQAVREGFAMMHQEEFADKFTDLEARIEQVAQDVNQAMWNFSVPVIEGEEVARWNDEDLSLNEQIKKKEALEEGRKIFAEVKPLPLTGSLLWEDNNALTLSMPDEIKQVADLQRNRALPSIFDESRHQEIASVKQFFDIDLDISGSTGHQGIFKLIDLACASVQKRLQQMFPQNFEGRIVPYSYEAHNAVHQLTGFIYPHASTQTERAFEASQRYLFNKEGYRSVVHIFDGAPNHLPTAIQQAEIFPRANIRYSQIVFAQDIRRFQGTIQSTILREMGADASVINVQSYEDGFTKIAEAAQGTNIVLWVTSQMAEAILSLYDLNLGQNFLREEQYRHLLG